MITDPGGQGTPYNGLYREAPPQEGGGVSRVNIGLLITASVTSLHTSEIYRSTGSSEVLPELVKSLDLPNVRGIQFMPYGVVRVTYKEPAQCDAAHAGGIPFRGTALRTTPVDSRSRLVYVRDLPLEVPDDGLQVYLRAFGVVHSCSRQTYPGMPDVSTGTRLVKVTLTKDLPSFARVSGYDVRFWYQGQPQACPVCRSYGHRVKDCPFNGLCRRCRQPGHMARECPSRLLPTVESLSVLVNSSEVVDSGDEVYFASCDEADDSPSISASEDVLVSGDESVLAEGSVALPPRRSVLKRPAPPAVPSEESSVDLRDNELSPVSQPVSDSVPVVPDSVPGTPESASAVVVPAVIAPDPVSGKPESASAAVESPVPKRRKKKPRSSKSAVASSPAKSASVHQSVPDQSIPVQSSPVDQSAPVESAPVVSVPAKSVPVESVPAMSVSVPSAPVESAPVESVPAKSVPVSVPAKSAPVKSSPLSYWEVSRRSGFGRVVDDGCGAQIYFDFGCLSRSVEIESTTFEYDRFVKYVHHGFGRNVGPYPCKVLPAGAPAKFPGQ